MLLILIVIFRFKDKQLMKKHLGEHRIERIGPGQSNYECHVCGETFRHKTKLYEHRSLFHSNDRPFECWLCHKTYEFSKEHIFTKIKFLIFY